MDRRTFVRLAISLAALGTAVPRALAQGAGQTFFGGHDLPLGLQLYTLGPDLDADFAGTLAEVGRIGYRIVELAELHGRTAAEIRIALDAARLTCSSMHIARNGPAPALSLSGDLGELARIAHAIGVTDVVMPDTLPLGDAAPASGAQRLDTSEAARRALTMDDYRRTADFLSAKARSLRAEGLRLSYHNHNFEFAPLAGGTAGLDVLLRETDAQVSFELDVGWVAAAGQDPVALLKAHPHRFTQMHVKDLKASTKPNFAMHLDPTEVGWGSVDWKQVLPAAYAAGVRRFYVEQEPPFGMARTQSIARSYRYLAALRA